MKKFTQFIDFFFNRREQEFVSMDQYTTWYNSNLNLSGISGNFRFSSNFRRAEKVFILARFKFFWMFWKAMSLNRSFLLSKSRGARLWYPLVPILREEFLGKFSLIFCSVLTQSFSNFFHIPLWGVPYVPTDHQKHRESTSYIPLELSWKSYVNPSRDKKVMPDNVWGDSWVPPPTFTWACSSTLKYSWHIYSHVDLQSPTKLKGTGTGVLGLLSQWYF